MTRIHIQNIEVLISSRRLFMFYMMSRKIKINLVQLLTNNIEQIKINLIKSSIKKFVDRLISRYTYPRNFHLEPNVDKISIRLNPLYLILDIILKN